MRTNKLLSIVVPTKDRYQYLKYLIELVASFDSDDVELVIQDNSEDNIAFTSYLNDLPYHFIKYHYNRGQLPMSVNSDKAILNSNGEYVCFLGDDDGLTKYTIDCARWMKKNGIEAVKSSEIFYYWPCEIDKSSSSYVRFFPFTGTVTYPDAFNELVKVLKKGITDRGGMPLVYHSIVSRKTMDIVYDKLGTFFPGNSPDISNAVSLSLIVSKFAFVDMPLAFSGCSVFHGGGIYANGRKGQPYITEVPWFLPNVEQRWNKNLPKIAAPSLIWADSTISALTLMKREDLLSMIDFDKTYTYFIIKNPQYRDCIKKFYPNGLSFVIHYYKALFIKCFNAVMIRLKVMTDKQNRVIIHTNLNNVIEVARYLERIVLSNKLQSNIFN